MLSDILRDIASIFAPRTCPVCRKELAQGDMAVCTLCEITAPLTNLWQERDNAMTRRFDGIIPVECAAALFWYVEGNPWRKAVHNFKYRGEWLSAYNLGRWFGVMLRQSGNFDDVDIVVPVPLHWVRRLGRGYNQSEYIARGIAKSLGAEYDDRSVKRHRYNRTQTSKLRTERWDNVEGIFKVSRAKALQGKHILLVDDVFTTGATIMSLGQTIIDALPDCRLSVATLSTTRRSVGVEQ